MVKREKINNFNPKNRLKLNQFHQQSGTKNRSQSKKLKKKERDIERLIAYQKVAPEVKEGKVQELKKVREELGAQKKTFERSKRKEFFMETKYAGIKLVEKKKVTKMLNKVKAGLASDPNNNSLKQQEQELVKKLRYILHYPKTLKYVSLFPTSELTEEARVFQNKIMGEIQEKHRKGQEFKNKYQQEDRPRGEDKDKKISKDSFFIVE